MPGISSSQRAALEAALFEFQRAPTRHLVALRQPPQLFEAVREVLQLAGGRAPDESGPPPDARVVNAACCFVRAGLLHPAATHYGVLGLEPHTDAGEVKERYRQVVRLLHPDVAIAHAHNPWPADAAGRVNLAYEVLSSPERRQAYDEELKPAARPQFHSAEAVRPAPRPTPVAQPEANPRGSLRWLATAFGVAGGLAVLLAWFASGQPDKETLVQRQRPESPPSAPAAAPGIIIAAAPSPPSVAPVAASPSESARITLPAAQAPAPAVTPPTPPAVATPPQPPAPAPAPPPAKAESPPAVLVRTAAPPVVAPQIIVAIAPAPSPAAAPLPPPVPAPIAAAPAPVPVPAPVPSVPPAAPLVAVAAPVAAAAPALAPAAPVRASPPAPTMTDVHPHLARLLQQIEGGWGDRLAGSLEREVRNAASTQALVQHYNSLVEGVGPVKVSNVDFKSQRRDERLVVTGQVMLQVRDATTPTRRLPLQAEFVLRDGLATLTRLSRAPE